jgi:hypothetical protein
MFRYYFLEAKTFVLLSFIKTCHTLLSVSGYSVDRRFFWISVCHSRLEEELGKLKSFFPKGLDVKILTLFTINFLTEERR